MNRCSPPQVLCFGEALIDRLGPLGGDPASDRPLQDCLGGAPANVACALARLGSGAALIGRLGNDGIAAAFNQLFAERGVDTTALQSDPLRPSRIVLVRRDADGERSFGGFSGDQGAGFADQAIEAAALASPLEPLLEGARWLLIGTIPLASPASAAALQLAIDRASARGVALAIDLNWRPTFWSCGAAEALESIRPLLSHAALLKFSAEEADWIAGSRDPAAISAGLPQKPAVIVTDGANGLAWWLGGQAGSMAAFKLEVVDTTGAGDAFLAGLLHRLCLDPSLLTAAENTTANPDGVRQAMRFGSACGALVCAGSGAIEPQPSAAEVETFLQQFSADSSGANPENPPA
ncbi:carbohydrate kinase [Synechococcus sp. CS-602]|uniref:carbohydrate kinase family protein n=1 Tax=Synechococcaceae TaxID=1890426 RepID=UPI0008FF6A73|nr:MULTISPECIES: carbohydrate kinase [Synechococcaceae]MCT4364480.1 carbohydrate kinase [Candidatus Regnicoccus frigidus MAG-AL1]APD48059.1 ribokinase [Synechococcus sp. SynAce01]MCT0203052.1 carbohydrate kinase [Synechococcus sp. CS-603]MCT0204688.1 carbohydrate kinase [Synechococcus sp. CS-602]MCT0246110.1 carbohydrate kinase [Synechococcus sp. CS-601]